MTEIGYWIDTCTPEHTALTLLQEYRGSMVSAPGSLNELPPNKALVVVAYCPDLNEEGAFLIFEDSGLHKFIAATEVNRKTYLIMDRHVAHNLANYHPA